MGKSRSDTQLRSGKGNVFDLSNAYQKKFEGSIFADVKGTLFYP